MLTGISFNWEVEDQMACFFSAAANDLKFPLSAFLIIHCK